MLTRFINNAFVKLLVYANVFIAICSLAQVFVTYVVFSLPVNYNNTTYLIFIMLSTYLQYNVQRGYLINQTNLHTDRSVWLMMYKKKLMVSVGLCLLVVLFLCNNLSALSIGIMVGAEVISTLYYLPPFNLRKHGYIKPFLISLIWVISCVIVPLIENDILTAHNFLFAVSQFCFIAVLCLLFDLKDSTDDYLNGVNTYANKFGEKITKAFCVLLCLIGFACFYYYSKNQSLNYTFGCVFLLTTLTVIFSSEKKHSFYYYLWVDGLLLLQGIAVYVLFKNSNFPLNNF
jgi:hypothetical protein